MTLTKPDPGDPFGSGATTSTTVVGAIVDYINEAPINVMETAYGAVGNGTTDDKAAINSAINVANAAGGGRVYLPRLHAVKGPVVLKDNVELIGNGPGGSGLKAVATWSGAAVITGSPGVAFTTVKDMKIDANSLVAKAYAVGAGGVNAGHNLITRCRVLNATSVGIDIGFATSGSESHCIHNDISGCPTAIKSGDDNEIIANNMGSFTDYGIDLAGGGCYVAGNHPVANQAGAVCLRATAGNIHQIIGNYFDHGGVTLDAPMVLLEPAAGNTIRGAIISNNTFLAPTITTTGTYPAIRLDFTNGLGLSGTVIANNTAIGQSTTHEFSALVDGVNSPTDTILIPGFSYFVAEPYTNFTPSLIQTGLVYDGVTVKPVNPRTRYIDVAVSGAGTYTVDSQYGPEYLLTVTTGSGFTVGNPTNKVTGRLLTYRILNSFGTMGTLTWDTSFNLGAAWTNPASGFSRSITFWCDGTKWREHSRTSADA